MMNYNYETLRDIDEEINNGETTFSNDDYELMREWLNRYGEPTGETKEEVFYNYIKYNLENDMADIDTVDKMVAVWRVVREVA